MIKIYYVGQDNETKKVLKKTLSRDKIETELSILHYQIPIAKQRGLNNPTRLPTASDYPIVNLIEITDKEFEAFKVKRSKQNTNQSINKNVNI